jgi:hypothetical protein
MPSPKFHPLSDDLCGTPTEQDELEREKAQVREMMQRYKNVFASEEGRLVLGDILTLCHFGETLNPTDPVQAAEYNLGITILRMAGGLDSIYLQLGIGR